TARQRSTRMLAAAAWATSQVWTAPSGFRSATQAAIGCCIALRSSVGGTVSARRPWGRALRRGGGGGRRGRGAGGGGAVRAGGGGRCGRGSWGGCGAGGSGGWRGGGPRWWPSMSVSLRTLGGGGPQLGAGRSARRPAGSPNTIETSDRDYHGPGRFSGIFPEV